MIFNADWRNQFNGYVVPRLSVAHTDLGRMVAWLRDVNVDIWTESPSDTDRLTPGRLHFSLEGWRASYKFEFQTLNAFNTAHGPKVLNFDAQAKTALDGYLTSIPAIATAFNSVMNNYKDGNGNVIQQLVAQTDRSALATAIESELQ